jgi:hypothetical protein
MLQLQLQTHRKLKRTFQKNTVQDGVNQEEKKRKQKKKTVPWDKLPMGMVKAGIRPPTSRASGKIVEVERKLWTRGRSPAIILLESSHSAPCTQHQLKRKSLVKRPWELTQRQENSVSKRHKLFVLIQQN